MLAHSVWNAMCELNIGIGIAYFLVPQLWRHFNAHIIDLTALSPFQKDNIPIHRRGSRKRSAAARTTPDGDSANMLPLVGVCFACNKVMKLSYKERISGQFVCPACGITNIRSLRAETGLGQGDFDVTPLLTYVECPACKAELELNREERASAEFACPECQAHYAQREHPGNGKLREFNLPGIAVCPLCGYEQHLIGDVRKEHEYTCKNCGEVIESVDG